MDLADVERLRAIKSFPSLVKYLRDELDWPVESGDFDELTYDYNPMELGLDAKAAVKIKEIKQLRPLTTNQPFGIFFINFDPKRLPVVVLRRILGALVLKKRASAGKAQQAAWALNDLLFISSYGEAQERAISFAYFREDECEPSDLPTLQVLGWDGRDTVLHLDHAHQTLKQKLQWPPDEQDSDAWRRQWASAFTVRHREVITTSQALAKRLAELARDIRNRVNAVLEVEAKDGPVRKLHAAFKEALIHDLSEDDFADMYAQTVAYGLLSARASRPAGLVADNILDMVPVTSPFLQELLQTFLHIGGRKRKDGKALDFDELGVTEVVEVLRSANMEAVLRDFGDRNPQEDPVIHFYEDFLKEYDKKKRTSRGVFYTPKPVVSFIVRSVHELLQTEFGLEDGLADTTTWGEMKERFENNVGAGKMPAPQPECIDFKIPEGVKPSDPFVTILDPATGTATFLVEVIEVIYATLRDKWLTQGNTTEQVRERWNDYVPKHLLPRLYGYELMMAPYAIAHMKIGLILQATGYQFNSEERVRIYLTNALEPAQDFSDRFEFDVPALAHEAKAVNVVKKSQRFIVVIGNPPYAGHSANNGAWISKCIREYYFVDGVALGERNPKWLQDDYVKFMRFVQMIIEKSRIGTIGYITNHGYFLNPTFRGMRTSLMKTFSHIFVFDLHGNSKKKEVIPSGGIDENIFDIQQGVGISLLIKNVAVPHSSAVYHADIWGVRNDKYERLKSKTVKSTNFTQVKPSPPFYLFIPQDENLRIEYHRYISICEAMPISSVGFVTSRDDFVLAFDRKSLIERFVEFRDKHIPDKHIGERYRLGNLSIGSARAVFSRRNDWQTTIVKCQYRPFDTRFICYADELLERPRRGVMRHLLTGKNIALLSARSNKSPEMNHFYCSKLITETKCSESSTQSCVFPLYITQEDKDLIRKKSWYANFSRDFVCGFTKNLRIPFSENVTTKKSLVPEDIFHYIYSIFHSPNYRRRYVEFLKIDFARIPLTSDLDMFRTLAKIGEDLVSLHLLESPKLNHSITEFTRGQNAEVEKVFWIKNTVWLDKAQTCGFQGVPEAVWNFHIGGYQVCEKWLKDRKGRTLTKEDIDHYQKIVVAINETIRIMKEIDEVIDQHGGWPGAFITEPLEPAEPASTGETGELPFA